MGELLNRGLQREILTRLSDDYPHQTEIGEAFGEQNDNSLMVNIHYLEEHGLLAAVWVPGDDDRFYPSDAKITAKGLDFLADDGGLGAILGVVTIKLHPDMLAQLLTQKVEKSEGDPTVKKQLIEKIKGLPADAVNALGQRLIERGIENLPLAVDALSNVLF